MSSRRKEWHLGRKNKFSKSHYQNTRTKAKLWKMSSEERKSTSRGRCKNLETSWTQLSQNLRLRLIPVGLKQQSWKEKQNLLKRLLTWRINRWGASKKESGVLMKGKENSKSKLKNSVSKLSKKTRSPMRCSSSRSKG